MKNALKKNLNWFLNSGIMVPGSGIWGVAERIAVCDGNEALEEMHKSFPAWMQYDGYCVLEQRRADCNFQTAFLFLLAFEVFGEKRYYDIAVNLLDFLYFRSGLLNRFQKEYPAGSWNWSHIKRESVVYFDDEAWCVFLQLEIAARHPELDRRYEMKSWGLVLGAELLRATETVMDRKFLNKDGHWIDPEGKWLGRLDLPHWGALSCMALARAFRENQDLDYARVVHYYYDYVRAHADAFIASEQAYALIGACAASRYLNDDFYPSLAERFARLLSGKMDSRGNLPAEHDEAPTGRDLADTIYTLNWALLGMQAASALFPDFREPCRKLLELILRIQDTAPEKQFNGCWRGMYDLEKRQWGGGNRFEGGAGSIYSGWTNAPIASALALELLQRNLFVC